MALFTINWQISVADRPGFSEWPSLAFHPGGQASMAYFASLTNAITLTVQNPDGSWTPLTVEPQTFFDTGVSLRYRFNQPACCYVYDFPGGAGSPLELRYAIFRGSLPWTIETVSPNPNPGYGIGSPSLAIGPQHQVGIAAIFKDKLRYFHSTGGGSWIGETVDDDHIGSVCALAFDPAGNPAIAYLYDAHPGGTIVGDLIKYASFNGTSWVHETIGEGHYDGVSHAFSPAGEPAVSYTLKTERVDVVMYAILRGGLWDRQVVALFANNSSLAFAPSGEPAIAYHDQNLAAIKYAVMVDRGWRYFLVEKTAKDQNGNIIGDFSGPSLAFHPTTGQPAIAYYDNNNATMRYAIGTVTQNLWDVVRDWLGNLVARPTFR